MRTLALTAFALLALGPLWGASPPADPDQPADPPRVLFTMTGRVSDVAERRYTLAASQEAFDAAWTEHMGDRVERAAQGWAMPPRVDFDAVSVLFIFGGRVVNHNGFTVEDTLARDDSGVIRFDAITYQTASFDGRDSGEQATPWMMCVIERPRVALVLEENVQGLIRGDPIWRERARFEPARAPLRVGAGELLDMEPTGQLVALETPLARTRYLWIDANPTEHSWEGVGVRASDDPNDERTVSASLRPGLHVRTEVDPRIGGIEHVRTSNGSTLAIAANEARQSGANDVIRLIGRWQAGGRGPALLVDSIEVQPTRTP